MKDDIKPNTLPKSNLTNWKNEPTVEDLKSDYIMAKGVTGHNIAQIDDWLDALNVEGKYKPKKLRGRSAIQPKLIRKQAEWRYSALSEPFLSNDDMFEIKPKTHKDRVAAFHNQSILNYQFNNQINKVKFIDDYVRTAVNEGTVIVRTSWEYEEHTVTKQEPLFEYMEATDEAMVQQIQQAMQLEQLSQGEFMSLPEELRESVKASKLNGRPIAAYVSGYEEVEVVEPLVNQPRLQVCDYESVIIDPTCDGDVAKAQFIVYVYESSKSDLEKLGIYENLERIQAVDTADINTGNLDTGFRFQDEPRKKFPVYEYWGYWDIDGSGIAVSIVATWVDSIMIRLERNPYPDNKLPFEVVQYLPRKDSVYGQADAELLEDNQRLIGALTRGMVDSMAKSANGQKGMRKDMLDPFNKRKFDNGMDYEFNPNVDPRQGVVEHSYPELPASTFNMLQMFNNEADAITGIQSFAGGISGDSLGQTATGVRGVLDAASKRELNILRRLSKGLENIAKKILAMNSVWLSDDEIIRITDEDFVGINRDNLGGGFDIKVSISTAETDNIKAQELAFMLQTMGGSLPFDMTKTILAEITRLRDMPDLARSIETYQPQPDPMAELEQQKVQLEIQKLQSDIQLNQARIQSEMGKADKLTAEANLTELDFVEQESGVTQERLLQLQQAQAEGNTKRDVMKAVMDARLKPKTNTSNK